jgi:hypothetical protein
MDKIYLGTMHDGEAIYLRRHTWDCGWYWAFGYVGNRNLHFHFEALYTGVNGRKYGVEEIFKKTKIEQSQWWVLRDLFIQAYALKRAAEVYRNGGHQTNIDGVTDILRSPKKAKMLNKDLEKVLDKIWSIAQDINNQNSATFIVKA